MIVHMLHLFGIIGWLGSASADVVLEALLKRSRSPDEQRTLMRLHTLSDRFVEGPGLVTTAVTGAIMLAQRGWLDAGVVWPTWFRWKIAAGVSVVISNSFALAFVYARERAARRVPASERPLDDPRVRFWTRLSLFTWIGIPLSIVAIALAGLYGQ